MKNFKIVLIQLSILFALTGCKFSTSKMIIDSEIQTISLSEENVDSNYSLTISGRDSTTISLWQFLNRHLSDGWSNKIDNRDRKHVNLQLIDETTILASLYNENELIEEISLKGEITGNYFVVNRKYRLIPFPPIWYRRNEVRTIIANSESGDLILIQGVANEGWALLILVGGRRGVNQYTFEKID